MRSLQYAAFIDNTTSEVTHVYETLLLGLLLDFRDWYRLSFVVQKLLQEVHSLFDELPGGDSHGLHAPVPCQQEPGHQVGELHELTLLTKGTGIEDVLC